MLKRGINRVCLPIEWRYFEISRPRGRCFYLNFYSQLIIQEIICLVVSLCIISQRHSSNKCKTWSSNLHILFNNQVPPMTTSVWKPIFSTTFLFYHLSFFHSITQEKRVNFRRPWQVWAILSSLSRDHYQFSERKAQQSREIVPPSRKSFASNIFIGAM